MNFANFGSYSSAENNFFEQGEQLIYDEKKFDESKFLLQRSIIFDPKDAQLIFIFSKNL